MQSPEGVRVTDLTGVAAATSQLHRSSHHCRSSEEVEQRIMHARRFPKRRADTEGKKRTSTRMLRFRVLGPKRHMERLEGQSPYSSDLPACRDGDGWNPGRFGLKYVALCTYIRSPDTQTPANGGGSMTAILVRESDPILTHWSLGGGQ